MTLPMMSTPTMNMNCMHTMFQGGMMPAMPTMPMALAVASMEVKHGQAVCRLTPAQGMDQEAFRKTSAI